MAGLAGHSFYTVKGYADIIGKHPRTIRRWIEEGKLQARKDRGGRCYLIIVKDADDLTKNEGTQEDIRGH